MRTLFAIAVAVVISLPILPCMNAQTTVPSTFFAMDINKNNNVDGITNDPWPTQVGVSFGVYRTLGSAIKWSDIDNGNGTYNWTRLDAWLSQVQSGQLVMFTAYWTPTLESGVPTDPCGHSGGLFPAGGCDLPSDVDTTDQYWKTFISELLNHVINTFGSDKISAIEVWNEPNNSSECDPPADGGNCTPARLARMTADAKTVAKAIDPNILIISPPVTENAGTGQIDNFFNELLAAGIAGDADILGFHGYSGPSASYWITLINSVYSDMATYGATNPVYDTEGSYGPDMLTNSDEDQAFLASYYLIQAGYLSQKFEGFSWYGWDFAGTNLWDFTNGVILPPGTAYVNVYQWIVGAHPVGQCFNPSGYPTSVWACNYTRSGGFQAQAVWDDSQTCSDQGTCTFRMYAPPAGTVAYRDLNGGLHSVATSNLMIGLKPIFLENQSR